MARRWRHGRPHQDDVARGAAGASEDGHLGEPDDTATATAWAGHAPAARRDRWPWSDSMERHPVFEGQPFAVAAAGDGLTTATEGFTTPGRVVEALARAAEMTGSKRWPPRRLGRGPRRSASTVADGGADEPVPAPVVADAPAPAPVVAEAAEPTTELPLPPPDLPPPPDALLPEPPAAVVPEPPPGSAERRAEELLESAAATAGSAPPLAAEESEPAMSPDDDAKRRRAMAWLTSTQAAAALILLLGVGVGFLVYKAASPVSSRPKAAPTFPSAKHHATSSPSVPAYVPPSAAPKGSTTTPSTTVAAPTPKPATAPAGAVAVATPTTVAAPPQPCTADDLAVAASTDRTSYAPGQPVAMSTTITARRSCVFQPVATGAYDCPTSIVVHSASGTQTWPWQGQGEQCSAPAAQTLQAGATETVYATWNGQVPTSNGAQDAPPGTYSVVGTWSWSAGSGQPPVVIQVASPAFTIS